MVSTTFLLSCDTPVLLCLYPPDWDWILPFMAGVVLTLVVGALARGFRKNNLPPEAAGELAERKRPGPATQESQPLLFEQERLDTGKLESLSVLAGGIAHDFNNILTAILINISTAKMDLAEDDDKYAILNEAQNACLQAKELTEQLLTFSKRGVPLKRATSIGQLIRDTIEFTLRGSNVTCDLCLSEDLWIVEVDEVQISQVIANIVINAVQAMPDGGRLEVSAANVVVNGELNLPLQDGDYVQMTFQDQGHGIPKEQLAQIFDPYFTTKPDGSGLGLSTSYAIIKNHDGLIIVQSEVGSGTTVTCYLPATRLMAAEQPNRGAPKGSLPTGSGRILIMDDEPFIRNSLVTMLTRLGYEVEVAEDGDDAVEIYRNSFASGNRFDAIIVDLTVPGGKGGKETLRALKRIDPEVKAIVSSGYLNDPVLQDFRQHGFIEVLKKPFEMEEVSRKIHEVVSGSRE